MTETDSSKKLGLRLLIPSPMAENIVGEDKTILKKLKKAHSCKVRIPESEGPEQVMEITGKEADNVLGCLAASVPWLYGLPEGADDGGGNKDLRFLIHQSIVVSVIGEAGDSIRNIRESSQAQIKVHTKVAPLSTDRVVQVEGTLDQVMSAAKQIYNIVFNHQSEVSDNLYDPANYDPINAPDYGGFVGQAKKKSTSFQDVKTEEEDEKKSLGFHQMELDERIQKAIAKLGWIKPTLIQERGIPLLLEGKDLLARGRTGSGKTGAFSIPLLQRILDIKNKKDEVVSQCVRGVVLCPSRELAKQTTQVLTDLANSCMGVIRILDIGAKDVALVKPLLKDLPDIIVGTPGRLAEHIREGNVDLKKSLEFLVIDEADLVFTFGFEQDIKFILENLPQIFQAVLTSATLSDDVEKLKKLVLNNPVILKLTEPDLPDASKLTQYVFKLEEQDKYVLIYALFKLQLIRGKTIIFVSTVDRCYKLKLYLEQFAISCCVLNSELPAASRCHAVNQFNRGVYNVMVAADEKFLEEEEENNHPGRNYKVDKDKQNSKRVKDKESGVARGIDFLFVSNVINFDFPKNYDSYIHRVGRTARAGEPGTALSLVAAKENYLLEKVEARLDESAGGQALRPYQFKMEELEGFRYRAKDAWHAVTRVAVREARLKEIKQELLNSKKLKAYFEDNPKDRQILRHDKSLHTVKHQEHMKNIPEYIIPETLKTVAGISTKKKRKNFKPQNTQTQKKYNKRKADPLDFGMSKRKK
eukprot:TRINITY_DN4632_c0_g1_i16.p1 TRINITY_DN4632_c0_g1~~TRINITY_DN4632_c0_g1_i16.p1  ORF type:complete len:755 (-),score=211.92 TRINITY_DN4632_c0_g1_i16:72-2336(-)